MRILILSLIDAPRLTRFRDMNTIEDTGNSCRRRTNDSCVVSTKDGSAYKPLANLQPSDLDAKLFSAATYMIIPLDMDEVTDTAGVSG